MDSVSIQFTSMSKEWWAYSCNQWWLSRIPHQSGNLTMSDSIKLNVVIVTCDTRTIVLRFATSWVHIFVASSIIV